MSPILSILFATAAAAEITTSIWLPSPYQKNETHIGFYASVIGVEDGKTTLALQFDNKTNLQTVGYYVDDEPNTMTFWGNSRFESVTTTTELFDGPEMTVMYGCQLTSSRTLGAACRYSSNGPAVYSSFCDNYSDYTDVVTLTKEYTYDEPYSVSTEITTIDYRTKVPKFCLSGSELPQTLLAHTYEVDKTDIATYQVIITAGEEKLSATAGATPSNRDAMITGSGVGPTGTEDAPPEETGAGASLSLHPALAGLGAAAMAFLL